MAGEQQQGSVLDQAMGTDSTQQAAPATVQPAQGGGVLDQAMQGTADEAKKNDAVVQPEQSSPYNWLERTEAATVGRLLPQDNKVLNWINEHVAQPPVRMGKEVGNIAASKGLEGIAHAEEGLGNAEAKIFNAPNMTREIPAWAKGNEGAYLKYRYEQENPRLAGMTTSLFNFAGELVGNPTNWPLMSAGEAKSAVMKVFNKAFGYQMGVSAVTEGKDLWDNWDKMSTEARWHGITDLFLHTVAAREALKGHGTGKGTEAVESTPKAAKPTKVAGEVPVTQTHAGVEVPVSAQHAESVSEGTNPRENKPVAQIEKSNNLHDITEFQRQKTAPAATAAAHSILGQSAEDLINQHDATIAGEPMPASVAENNQPSKYETIDDAANALNTKARQTTYAKADDISAREQAEWQRQVEVAHQNDKSAVDHYNQMVDEHNANLQESDEPMERITHDPSKVDVPERPKTYGELKGAVDRAYADLKSPDAEVRENAVDSIDKAEKNLDNWFKQHSDEISPEEYTSAKKLIYAGARFQEIANSLRNSITNDNLTGNKLRSVISAMDTRMMKRGEPVGAFERLVGKDVSDNWRKVSRLFDPIQGAPKGLKSLGHLAMHFAVAHMLGPLGLVGKVGAHFLLDRVLSSPEWGKWFSDLSSAVKDKISDAKEIPQNILDRFKSMWDGLKNREEGAAGADITPRAAGSPVPPKFGRVGLGGTGEEVAPTPAPQSTLEEAMKPGPDLTEEQNQMTHIGTPEHGITSDFETQVPQALKDKWQGKPHPPRVNTPKGYPKASYIDELADHLNANFTHEQVLRTSAHEVAHALIQHELGIPTDDSSSMELGNYAMVKGRQDRLGKKMKTNGVAGGGWSPGNGWQDRFDAAKAAGDGKQVRSLLHDYVTQLMGGRAVEELMGTSPKDVDLHVGGDEAIAKRVMSHYGVPSYLHSALMREATTRAKAILHDKWDTVSHMAGQLSNHFGGGIIDSKTFHHYRQGGTYENKP